MSLSQSTQRVTVNKVCLLDGSGEFSANGCNINVRAGNGEASVTTQGDWVFKSSKKRVNESTGGEPQKKSRRLIKNTYWDVSEMDCQTSLHCHTQGVKEIRVVRFPGNYSAFIFDGDESWVSEKTSQQLREVAWNNGEEISVTSGEIVFIKHGEIWGGLQVWHDHVVPQIRAPILR